MRGAGVLRRLRDRAQFELERLLLRGPFYRLLVLAAVIGALAVLGGLVVHLFTGGFPDTADAIWWAFLRLTDPGYLGEDQGAFVRSVSVVITTLGSVIFFGALVAILTQSLEHTVARLQSGITPIAQTNHFLILGWTNRTATLVQELLLSEERVRRFLHHHGARRLNIVILAEQVDLPLVQELRDRLGPLWDDRRITLRSGTPLRPEHLHRVDYLNAAAILLPAPERGLDAVSADGQLLKVLLTVAGEGRGGRKPLMVAELADPAKAPVARRAYGGPIELLTVERLLAQLLAQGLRRRGLLPLYSELLSHEAGNEVYIREAEELAGSRFGEVQGRLPQAVALGLLVPGEGAWPQLNPPPERVIGRGEKLVVMAQDYARTVPSPATAVAGAAAILPARTAAPVRRRILCLGWSRLVPALVEALAAYPGDELSLDVLSTRPAAARARLLEGLALDARQLEGDYTRSADLQRLRPGEYDAVLMLASDRSTDDAEADTRTIVGYLLLDELLQGQPHRPQLVVELVDPDNRQLLRHPADEVVVTPQLVSHMLSQVALRRELRGVFEALLAATGAEPEYRPVPGELRGRQAYAGLRAAAAARGEVLLGLRQQGELRLNPDSATEFVLGGEDELLLLGGRDPEEGGDGQS